MTKKLSIKLCQKTITVKTHDILIELNNSFYNRKNHVGWIIKIDIDLSSRKLYEAIY